MGVVYLNGHFLAPEEARIPVTDRGFTFGDAVYEVIPVFGGRALRLREHLARLRGSLAALEIPEPLSEAEWHSLLPELIARNGGGDQSLYLQVTRGIAPRAHVTEVQPRPTVLAMSEPMAYPEPAPVAVITLPDERWAHCDVKTTALVANVMARRRAAAAGAQEAILIRDGRVAEGAASNVFVVSGGTLRTPPPAPVRLPGITRDLVVELAPRAGVPCEEAEIPEAELRAAEEIWLTSSVREILPVGRLDDRPVGAGAPGPVWQRLWAAYQQYKRALVAGGAADADPAASPTRM